jgi:type IV secretory pathway VirB9-like protein
MNRWIRVSVAMVVGVAAASVPCRAQEQTGVRRVAASEQSLIPLQTRLRFTTMIVLPDDEEILDVVCGDRDYWVISATQNIAHVKPAKAGAETNLNLVTRSGAIYSFLLTEKAGPPDLKVHVDGNADAVRARPRYFSAAQVEALEEQLTAARAAVDAADRRATEIVATYRQDYPTRLQFSYVLPKYEKPFLVRSIWHDGQFTYVKSDATELPVLYELADGKPALVNFQVYNGTYVVPNVLERGYLAIGKARYSFAQGR